MSEKSLQWVTKVLFSSVDRFGWHYPFPTQWINDNFGSVELFRNEFNKELHNFDLKGLIWNRIIELDGCSSFDGKGPNNLSWRTQFKNDELWGEAWKNEEVVIGRLYLNNKN